MTVEVPLGDVLRLDRDEVVLDPSRSYRTAGIYSFGRGVFEREMIRGADTSYSSLFRLHEGQVILSRLNGWEGAVDVVTEEIAGCHVSNEYPTFSLDEERADSGFLRWITRWPAFWDRLVPRGSMIRRKRVQPEQFLKVLIPLPPIEEQRLVVDRLNRLQTARDEVTERSTSAAALAAALKDSSTSGILERGVRSGWALRAIGDVADVNPRPDRLAPGALVMFVPMAAVDGTRGSIAVSETREASEVAAGHKQFRQGDVIFARITPCMQNGKSAIFDGVSEVAYGSTEFHVIRPGPEVTSDWLHRIVRTRAFRDAAAERFVGTAGQQRVPADYVRNARIPVPPVEQQAEVVREIDQLSSRFLEVAKLRERASRILFALQPAALHEAFAELS